VHLPLFFQFYNYKSAPFRFYDYQGRQRSNAEMANILLNGGKKYNLAKRKHTRKYRRRRKKNRKENAVPQRSHKSKKRQRWPKTSFKRSESVPLIVSGDGMKNKDAAPIKGIISGTTSILYKELKQRSKLFKSLVVDVNEFRTSKVLYMMLRHTKSKNLF
jgi:hypothetical protein